MRAKKISSPNVRHWPKVALVQFQKALKSWALEGWDAEESRACLVFTLGTLGSSQVGRIGFKSLAAIQRARK